MYHKMSLMNSQPLCGINVIFVGFMVLMIWTAPLHGSEYECPSGWTLFSSSCYYLEMAYRTWSDASTVCAGYGARLAEITSDDENSFIANGIGMDLGFRIDCRDVISEGDWLCGDDNHAITYTNWNPGEPNNLGGEDSIIAYQGAWYDVPSSNVDFAPGNLCKKDASSVVAETRTNSMRFKRDDTAPNYCLENNIIETIKPSTLIYCAGQCLKSETCASFNYIERRRRCELNSITRETANDSEFIELLGCAYYDIIS